MGSGLLAHSPEPKAHSSPLSPPERIDHMFHIFLEKIVYNTQRVCVGSGIEIERSPEKMTTGINGGRFRGMLKGYFICIVSQVVESVQRGGIFIAMVCFEPVHRHTADSLIAQVYPGIERGYIYIHGICAVLAWIKIAAVSHNIAVYRVIKTVWKSRTVKRLVLMLREWYGKIPFWTRGIIAVAGKYWQDKRINDQCRDYSFHVDG